MHLLNLQTADRGLSPDALAVAAVSGGIPCEDLGRSMTSGCRQGPAESGRSPAACAKACALRAGDEVVTYVARNPNPTARLSGHSYRLRS